MRSGRRRRRIETGVVHVNDATSHDEPIVAFRGEKRPGRRYGEWGLTEFTTPKWISVRRARRIFPC
ncbi:hypothetical protein ACQPXB_37880 [Amycolatopsis sp. CA-161197]|uniref:hypothetical protein n=1 Tax=Amycolatopsis sp. CA-161197 TaxID=3239922 RepID=UPI003D90DF09